MTLLRKHGLWLVLATLAGMAGAFLYLLARPVSYTSSSQVDVEANTVARATPVTPNMETEAQVATSGLVVARAARALGMTPGTVSAGLSAKTVGTGNVLSISCTMPAPATAQLCSAATAGSYIAFRNDARGSLIDRADDLLHATLVTVASLPLAPAGPGLTILLPIGAILGLLVGIGGVAIRDYLDDRVRDAADLERSLDAPVLAEVPRIRRRGVNAAFAFRDAPATPAAEAYRYLRARVRRLLGSGSHDGGAVLLVAGALSREGRTSVAINLATAIASAGETVILVDADLRHPSLSEGFEAGERPGLAELLAGRASLEEVAVATGVRGLRLVSAGRTGRSPDMLEVTRLSRALAAMRAAADVVIVDSPPVLTVSDAITLAGVSDLVAVVADLRRTGRGDVRAAGEQIRAAGPQAIVGILNGVGQPFMKGSPRRAAQESASLAPLPSVPSILASSVPARGPNGQGGVSLSGAHVGAGRRPSDAATDPEGAASG
ncbi:MAG TPA: AAA family ATPase [Streptosporangiaceae bacterium]|nr:AAA family ATPase [Streptosporangiaceae bacterium]